MLVFRSLALGMLGACLLLLSTRPTYEVHLDRPASRSLAVRPRCPLPPATASIVDVAPGVPPESVPGLIRLGPGEHVISVNDRATASDLQAGADISALATPAGGFIDIAITGGAARRRVLVLMH